jgi:hypothetical protein
MVKAWLKYADSMNKIAAPNVVAIANLKPNLRTGAPQLISDHLGSFELKTVTWY